MTPRLKTILNYLLIFTIFSGALSFNITSFAELRLAYLIMAVVLILWLSALKGLYYNRVFMIGMLFMVIFSLYNVSIDKGAFGLVAKQAFGIAANSVIFYTLIKFNDYDIVALFKIYLKFAFWVAVIGVFQELSFLTGFKWGYDYSRILPLWKLTLTRGGILVRVNSILLEASSFCSVMMPAFFAGLAALLKKDFTLISRFRCIVIILAFVLSFSTIGYLGIIVSLSLIFFSRKELRRIFLTLALIISVFFILYWWVPDFKWRVDDSIEVLTGRKKLEAANFSTTTFFSNAIVAWHSFKSNPLFGSGLGSHELSYNKFINKAIDVTKVAGLANTKDANSLFLRLMSETGLFGLVLIFIFIVKFYLKYNSGRKSHLWLINNASLSMIVLRLVRQGHYFVDGFFFFIWLYYFSKIASRQEEELKNERHLP